MKVLLFSDMHGNRIGLDAVLDDTVGEKFDQMVCLGDAIQGGPHPKETLTRLSELGCPVVMGNADAWLLSGSDPNVDKLPSEMKNQMSEIRLWSLSQLSKDDQKSISEFSPVIRLSLPEGKTLICGHGSPRSFHELIWPTTSDEELRAILEPEPGCTYTGGHTHVQFVRHLRECFFFNPGSAGSAYRHDRDKSKMKYDPFSEYAVLTCEEGNVRLEFRRVSFDISELKRAYRESGRPFAEEAIAQFV